MDNIRIYCLGTGDAYSTGGRFQTAYLIETPEGSLLLDCGATILASLNSFGWRAGPIDAIFLSHFHGDHFAGLPFLFLHYIYVEPRSRPLRIIGPPGVESRVRALFKAMYADTSAEPLPFALEFVEMRSGERMNLGGMAVAPFPVPHQKAPLSFGCEIEAEGRKIVYSGDAGWTEDFVARTKDSDLFICECSFYETRLETHLDFPRIKENLGRLGAKRIILTHWGEEVVERQRDIDLEMAVDGLVIELQGAAGGEAENP